MVFNPMTFATPQQREQLAKMQPYTEKIKYIIHTQDNRVEIRLETDDDQAMQLIPQLVEALVGTNTQMFYTLFNMKGERV